MHLGKNRDFIEKAMEAYIHKELSYSKRKAKSVVKFLTTKI